MKKVYVVVDNEYPTHFTSRAFAKFEDAAAYAADRIVKDENNFQLNDDDYPVWYAAHEVRQSFLDGECLPWSYSVYPLQILDTN